MTKYWRDKRHMNKQGKSHFEKPHSLKHVVPSSRRKEFREGQGLKIINL